MTQLSALELAKQGDAEAIAILINRSLQPKGIKAEARRLGDRLDIILQSDQVPNQKALELVIRRGMLTLQIDAIKTIHIYARRTGSDALAWESEFEISSPLNISGSLGAESVGSGALALSQTRKTGELWQDRYSEDRPFLFLVPKLSQIERNPQAYQDIIVRFSDEYGTVRCLATLTEVVQAIAKSSFTFSSLATNPNLRTLLDTMAELSSTDDNGDQIISHVSVLQPGQLWQKAKIRIITQIVFEPDRSETDPHSAAQASAKEHVITLDVIETPESQSSDRDPLPKDREEETTDFKSITLDDLDIGDALKEDSENTNEDEGESIIAAINNRITISDLQSDLASPVIAQPVISQQLKQSLLELASMMSEEGAKSAVIESPEESLTLDSLEDWDDESAIALGLDDYKANAAPSLDDFSW
jgi:hypothetical protein